MFENFLIDGTSTMLYNQGSRRTEESPIRTKSQSGEWASVIMGPVIPSRFLTCGATRIMGWGGSILYSNWLQAKW